MALSSHQKRWVTVLLLVPILVLFFLKAGTLPFTILVMVVCILALWEYFSNFVHTKSPTDPGFLLACLLSSLILLAAHAGSFKYMFSAMWFSFFVFAVRAMIRYSKDRPGFNALAAEALSVLYIPCLMSSFILLRTGDRGVVWLFFALFLAFMSDTGAFYSGRTFGRHKLSPKLSPKKTIEGYIGGITFDLITVSCFKLLFFPELLWTYCIFLAFFAATFCHAGDLFESMLKRTFGVKDSGALLPGHGGMLDRIDGLMFVGPMVYAFGILIQH